MPPRSRKDVNGLGRAIIKNKIKVASTPVDSLLHTTEAEGALKSVTHEGNLDEFLNTAELAATDFTAERQNVKIIETPNSYSATTSANPYLLTSHEESDLKEKQGKWRSKLRVPRRPYWERGMTPQQLERSERDAFLDWRRGLAELSEGHDLLLTPFERNLEVWRQLWRVLERSHLVVQIVDARNPENFRCSDLDEYVSTLDVEGRALPENERGGLRKSLLLINKADLLTLKQRKQWADHFDSKGVRYAFFSALNAAALQEEEALRAAQEAQDEEDRLEAEKYARENPEEGDDDDEEESDLEEGAERLDLNDDEWSSEDEEALPAQPKNVKGNELAPDGEEEVKRMGEREVDPQTLEEGYEARTRVLSVLELEELFVSEAPELKDFINPQHPKPPSKLVVGLVGYPNVGKSSTINALLGSHRVSVSSTPGKTKHFQTLPFTDSITLCDCPGLVFPQFATTKAELVTDGVLPIDQMREYSAPVELICRRVPRDILEGTYGIRIEVEEKEEGGSGMVTAEEFLSAYAIARGFTRASFGLPDTSRAARFVLKDYVNARLLFAHPPPGHEADEFNAESRENQKLMFAGKKRAPVTRVGKNSDAFVKPTAPEENQFSPFPKGADNRPPMALSNKARALDGVFFKEDAVLASRPMTKGTASLMDGKSGFSRTRQFGHQGKIADNGNPLTEEELKARKARLAIVESAEGDRRAGGKSSKKHFKEKRGKKRSGAGYD